MSFFNMFSILSLITSIVIVGFHSLSSLMGKDSDYMSMTLADVMFSDVTDWFANLSFTFISDTYASIAETRLFILLLIASAVFYIIGKINDRR